MIGVVAFVGAMLGLRTVPRAVEDPGRGGFGVGYWRVVAAEVAAGLGGAVVLTRLLHTPQASLSWVTLVVGLHCFGLGVIWRARTQHVIAALLTSCGLAGLVAVTLGASAQAAKVLAGVLPGTVLLGASYWGVAVARRRERGLGTPW